MQKSELNLGLTVEDDYNDIIVYVELYWLHGTGEVVKEHVTLSVRFRQDLSLAHFAVLIFATQQLGKCKWVNVWKTIIWNLRCF